MDIRFIDFISVSGRSWMHRLPAGPKIIAVVISIAFLLWTKSAWVLGAAMAGVLLAALSARLPMRTFLPLMFYPIIFLAFIWLSVSGLAVRGLMVIAFRVFAISGLMVSLLLSTSYPALFAAMGRVLPGFLVAALFFTYRSLFVISDSLNDVQTAMRLRGGIDSRHPAATLRRFGDALGHFLTDAIDSSQRIAEGLKLRGFANRIYYSEVRHRRDRR